MTDVILNNHDLQWAWDLAKESYLKWVADAKKKGITKKRKDNLMSYLVGKLGEVGSYNWLNLNGFVADPLFAINEDAPDIYTRNPIMRIEVKSWQKHQFPKLGRAIPSSQFEHICMYDHLVMWVHMDLYRPIRPLILKSTLEEICFLFKKPVRTIQLVEYSWTKELKQPGVMKNVAIKTKDGDILKSKQMTCCGNPIERFIADVTKHL
jgi:hypothetical protein